MPTVRIDGELAVIDFDRFDLDHYRLFIKAKQLPESQVSFDWDADRYTLTTPSRFAERLGVALPTATAVKTVELASHLFDYQRWAVALALEAKRFALWLDCVAGETVLQTPDGDFRIDELAARGGPIRVWSLAPDGSVVAAPASAPFRKGRADLFRFELSDGRSITVTRGHRFLTPEGWRAAGEIGPGDLLAISEHDLSASPPDAPCSTHTALGSTDGPRFALAAPLLAAGGGYRGVPSLAGSMLMSNRAPAPFGSLAIRPLPRHESGPRAGRVEMPFAPLYAGSCRRVVSVHYNRIDDYYDLHVPGYENYLANGIWNHNTGLGKTACYLEWIRQVQARTGGGKVLILAPLAVIPQTIEECHRFYPCELAVSHIRSREDLVAWCVGGSELPPVAITNYEKFIPGVIPELRHVAGLVADESSLLRSGGGVIKWNLIKSARGIEYKISCTATPAPNDAMEYASQAAFLEKLRTQGEGGGEGEILWTFFSKDKRGEWSIKPHAKEAFYRFMASWSLYLRDPVRFGFGDILSTLPAPEIIEERIELTDEQRELMTDYLVKTGKGMFADERMGVTERTKLAQLARGFLYSGAGKDRTIRRVPSRKAQRIAAIISQELEAGRQVLVWTTFDEEAVILGELLDDPDIAVLHGGQSDGQRLALLHEFRNGGIRCLISKPQLIGFGLNLQFVKSMIFSGFDDSFERSYQAVRRAYRFGQTESVRVFWPYVPALEGLVFSNIRQKEARFLEEVAAQEEMYRRAMAAELVGVAA